MDLERLIALFKERGERFACMKERQPNISLEHPNEINWIWTGFQLINQTHFANDNNQFLRGHLLYSLTLIADIEKLIKEFQCKS